MSKDQMMLNLHQEVELLREMLPIDNTSGGMGPIVLIDPGHGGIIANKYTTAPDKMADHGSFVFYEGVFNRIIAWEFARELYRKNFRYLVVAPWNTDTKLSERVDTANEAFANLPDSMYYLSIHGNAFGVEDVHGIEVFTSPGQTKSDRIATIMYQQLSNLHFKMRPGWEDGDPDKEARFIVLTQTKMPAVLAELGFYTNRKEAKVMASRQYIRSVVRYLMATHREVIRLQLV